MMSDADKVRAAINLIRSMDDADEHLLEVAIDALDDLWDDLEGDDLEMDENEFDEDEEEFDDE